MDVNSNKTTRSASKTKTTCTWPLQKDTKSTGSTTRLKFVQLDSMCFQQQNFKVKLHSHCFIHFVREFPANILPFAPRNWPSQKEKWKFQSPFGERPIWNFRICTTSYHHFNAHCVFFCVCPRVPLPFFWTSEPEIPIALENRTNQINFSSSTMNLQYLRTVRRHSWEN